MQRRSLVVAAGLWSAVGVVMPQSLLLRADRVIR